MKKVVDIAESENLLRRRTIERDPSPDSFFTRNRCALIVVIIFILFAATIAILSSVLLLIPPKTPILYQYIETQAIVKHLNKLQSIALKHGSRAIVTGYNESAEYVEGLLQPLDCELSRHYFDAVQWIENQNAILVKLDDQLSYQYKVDIIYARYGGDGYYNITRNVTRILNLGCNAADYTSGQWTQGNIALISISANSTADCDLLTKALTAQQNGAGGVILFNPITRTVLSNPRIRKSSYQKGDPLVFIPVLMATYSVGVSLSNYQKEVTLITNTTIAQVRTFNVLCSTKEGDPNSTIIIGSHLDGVLQGPGINDNGSGSSTNLEIALQWYNAGLIAHNKIIWAWWGAEEEGLLGSRAYLRDLSSEELESIAAGINMDMVGSANYLPGVLEWPVNPALNPPITGFNGTQIISKIYQDFYNNTLKKPYIPAPMETGSDYYSFLETGIPAGGTRAGAGDIKTEEIRNKCGGVAYVAYDPCYHQACDTVSNINQIGVFDFARATAHTLQTLAQSPSIISSFHTKEFNNMRTLYLEIQQEKEQELELDRE